LYEILKAVFVVPTVTVMVEPSGRFVKIPLIAPLSRLSSRVKAVPTVGITLAASVTDKPPASLDAHGEETS
jgi:hypothetical protein